MERRKALTLTAGVLGGAIIGSELFLLGCTSSPKNKALFSESDIEFLDEVGETILPETELSPGAKTAKIGLFMKTIVTDCYDQKQQEIFLAGIKILDRLSQDRYSLRFIKLNEDQRQELLQQLDNETREQKEDAEPHFFQMMKQLTIWGYFTSESGATQALRYNPIPGKFVGCVPYIKGDRAWAG